MTPIAFLAAGTTLVLNLGPPAHTFVNFGGDSGTVISAGLPQKPPVPKPEPDPRSQRFPTPAILPNRMASLNEEEEDNAQPTTGFIPPDMGGRRPWMSLGQTPRSSGTNRLYPDALRWWRMLT